MQTVLRSKYGNICLVITTCVDMSLDFYSLWKNTVLSGSGSKISGLGYVYYTTKEGKYRFSILSRAYNICRAVRVSKQRLILLQSSLKPLRHLIEIDHTPILVTWTEIKYGRNVTIVTEKGLSDSRWRLLLTFIFGLQGKRGVSHNLFVQHSYKSLGLLVRIYLLRTEDCIFIYTTL